MIIMGVDHSTKVNGIGVISLTADKSYCYNIDATNCNLQEYADMITREIDTIKPEVVVLEQVNVAGVKFGGNNIVKLAEYRAMVKYICISRGIPVYEINVSSMKKHLTGNGRAEKSDVANALCLRYKLDVETCSQTVGVRVKKKVYQYDMFDALGLATCFVDGIGKEVC